jgi:hypothetical protein
MTTCGPAPSHARPRARRLGTIRARGGDPAVLTGVVVVFLVSAVGQAVLQGYVHDDSVVTSTVLSVFGSMFLAAAIVAAARRHDQTTTSQRPSGREAR